MMDEPWWIDYAAAVDAATEARRSDWQIRSTGRGNHISQLTLAVQMNVAHSGFDADRIALDREAAEGGDLRALERLSTSARDSECASETYGAGWCSRKEAAARAAVAGHSRPLEDIATEANSTVEIRWHGQRIVDPRVMRYAIRRGFSRKATCIRRRPPSIPRSRARRYLRRTRAHSPPSSSPSSIASARRLCPRSATARERHGPPDRSGAQLCAQVRTPQAVCAVRVQEAQ